MTEISQSANAPDVVLVTGGTGSFGSTMVRRLLANGTSEIRILSRDELKQHEMRTAIADERMKFIIGDVRDYSSVDQASRGVDHVLHAAKCASVDCKRPPTGPYSRRRPLAQSRTELPVGFRP